MLSVFTLLISFDTPVLLLIIRHLFLGLIIRLKLILSLDLRAFFPFFLFLFIPVLILVLFLGVHFRCFICRLLIWIFRFLFFPFLVWFLNLFRSGFGVLELPLPQLEFWLFFRLSLPVFQVTNLYCLQHGLQHDVSRACSTSWSSLRTSKLR